MGFKELKIQLVIWFFVRCCHSYLLIILSFIIAFSMNKYRANVLFKLNFSCHCENIFFLLLMKTKEKHKQQWKLLIPLLQFLNEEEFYLCYDYSSSQFNKFQPIYNKTPESKVK